MNFTNKIILILVFAFCCLYKAQSKPNIGLPQDLPCNEYIINPNIDKFVGTWEGTNNGKYLKIYLKKEKINLTSFANLPGYECRDILIGFHKFSENNVEVENSLEYTNSHSYDNKWTISGSSYNSDLDEFRVIFAHNSKNKLLRLTIKFIDSNHILITKVENTEGIKVNEPGKPPYDYSISIPSDFILTKQ